MYFSFQDDNSRVILKKIPGELGSDYINASFVSVSTVYSTQPILPVSYFRDIAEMNT